MIIADGWGAGGVLLSGRGDLAVKMRAHSGYRREQLDIRDVCDNQNNKKYSSILL